MRYDNKL
ncbi:hypothetical protein V3C99_018048, partial [Haemonchus contortus]